MKYAALALPWGLICTLVVGCQDRPKVMDAPVSRAKSLSNEPGSGTASPSQSAGPTESVIGGFRYSVPGEWAEQSSKFGIALVEYSIPGKGGPARLTISSVGGGIEENIKRWRGQFMPGPNDPEARESPISLDGNSGTLVELAGTFTDMSANSSSSKNWRMLGAAIPLDGTGMFIKMTGPATTVEERRDQFLRFVESARAQK